MEANVEPVYWIIADALIFDEHGTSD